MRLLVNDIEGKITEFLNALSGISHKKPFNVDKESITTNARMNGMKFYFCTKIPGHLRRRYLNFEPGFEQGSEPGFELGSEPGFQPGFELQCFEHDMLHNQVSLFERGPVDQKYNTSHKSCGVTRRKRNLVFFF